MRILLLLGLSIGQVPAPTNSVHLPANHAVSNRKWDTSGVFQAGKATHYGPYPSVPASSEPGYFPNDVGVGCSNGQPGGDPNWNKILEQGVRINPLQNATVWPVVPTVAVSAAAWQKSTVCWQKLIIRNREKPSYAIEAVIVDFCPAKGCLWDPSERQFNVDIYGEESWKQLGGTVNEAVLQIEVAWPAGWVPYTSVATTLSNSVSFLILAIMLFWS